MAPIYYFYANEDNAIVVTETHINISAVLIIWSLGSPIVISEFYVHSAYKRTEVAISLESFCSITKHKYKIVCSGVPLIIDLIERKGN